jgi:hypothetical protein
MLRTLANTVAISAFATSPILACPFCESETGQQVRAAIFNSEFFSNAALTLLPFPFLAAIVGLIYVGFPTRKKQPPL